MREARVWLQLFVVCLMACTLVLAGCEGDNGSDGSAGLSAYEIAVQNGFVGTEEEWLASLDPTNPITAAANVEPEACEICHTGEVIRTGESHQEFYDELFQLGVIEISNVAYTFSGGNDVVTFEMTKDGADFDCTDADSLNIYFTEFTGVEDAEFIVTGGSRLRIGLASTLSYDSGTNTCTSTNAASALGDLSVVDGNIVIYGQDEELEPIKPETVNALDDAHITLARYPFAAILETNTGAGVDVDYVSAANVTGCQNCHNVPYFKHGYIVGDISQGGGKDFYTCKACHIDNGSGRHTEWQYRVDDPQGWANDDPLDATQTVRYAYATRLMNDVHMSHAMEFPYPQSMRNCNTCHAGKLDETLEDDHYTPETCKSCHPVDGGTDLPDGNGDFAFDTTDMALSTLMTATGFAHASIDLDDPAETCNECHNDGLDVGEVKIAPAFNEIHSGYNPIIYDESTGTKYADTIIASIDSVTVSGTDLSIEISAAGALGGLDATDIVPIVMVSFYGYDTKDFILSNHTRDANRNRMEKTIGAANALFTEDDADGSDGTWAVTLHMADFVPADPDNLASIPELIADGTVKKAEVAFRPRLENPAVLDEDGDPIVVGLNAVTKTVDVTADAVDPFVDDYFKDDNALVSVLGTEAAYAGTKGCHSCHDQLATTFHSGDRGGNIVVCRMCHVVTEAGSHIADQSRSIDSYVHAVHSFQAGDVDEIDFTDPVEVALYEEHITFLFPDFATFNCEACHTEARDVDNELRAPYDIPDQSKSMPGLLSETDELPGIPDTPEIVTGPASRACGGCHRAQKINTGDVSGLEAFNQHVESFGYRIENDEGEDSILYTVIKNIMSLFQ